MKAIYVASSLALLLASASASAGVQTVGGSMARSCYLAAEGHDASKQALFDCDRALTDQAMTQDDRVATHVNRGILRLLHNDLDNAEADFNRALGMDPSQPEAWLNKGIARYQRGDPASARTMFGRAIELRTSYEALAYYARGLANEDSGNIRQAYADLTHAQALRPNWSLPAAELARYQVRRR